MTPTLRDLYEAAWCPIKDHPNVSYPCRAVTLAETTYHNGHCGYRCRVLTNRTRRRWWLEISNNGWLRTYRTTASKHKAEEWIAAVEAYQKENENQ